MTTSDSRATDLNADLNYAAALSSVHHAIEQFDGCTPEEKEALHRELRELEAHGHQARSRAGSKSSCSAKSTPASRH